MEHNLLIFSDVHLGCDLVQHARPDRPERAEPSVRRDQDLIAMLRWYRERPVASRPWRLVIAGDFIDFAGMSVTPSQERTAPEPPVTDDEREYGLGNSEWETVTKLERVVAAHPEVFAALSEFVAAENELVVIRGNHDVDLHWPAVQRAFRDALSARGNFVPGRLVRAVRFNEWFYYERNRVFIEHGHQYDPYCSHAFQLSPVNPANPKASSRSLADVLKRYVVNPTVGLTESGHEDATLAEYVLFSFRLGLRGCLDLARRFFGTVARLVAEQWRKDAALARRFARLHERRLRRFARRRKLSVRKVKELAALWSAPSLHSVQGVLSSLMIDRALFGVASVVLVVGALVLPRTWMLGGILAALVSAACAIGGALWWGTRAPVDATRNLRIRAGSVANVLPAALVVMGHTHLPERTESGNATTYVNLGSWAEGDGDDGLAMPLPATRTHLVVEADDVSQAELRVWNSETGPSRYR